MTQTMEAPASLPARTNGNGDVPAQKLNMRAPVRDVNTLKNLLAASKQQLADVLPKHMTPERVMKVALIAFNKTPKLLECTIESVLQSIMQAAALGLDPGGALGSAYLVPYGNTCTLIPGYRGLIDLARRSGEIASISAEVVYKGDKFVYRKGTDPVLLHEPDYMAEQRDDDIIGSYMVAHLKDGGTHVEFMNRQQIEKIRKGSKAGNFGPWKDHLSEMCRKTAVRRGVKYLPISSRSSRPLSKSTTSTTSRA
jgi:recombination protein RecT